MKRGSILLLLLMVGCDTGARKDLPQDNQRLDSSDATVIVMPDQYPNITHKCLDTVGFWTTTNDLVVIVYNDPACPGAEGEPFIIDNVPGGVTP